MTSAPVGLIVARVTAPHRCSARGLWHIAQVRLPSLLLALAGALALPSSAAAYDRQLTLDLGAGWGIAPVLEAPNHGPMAALGTTIGFDDTWGLGFYAAWAVHPVFDAGGAGEPVPDPVHVGIFGVEGLYYIDIVQVVPFFGVGVDVLPVYDGRAREWRAEAAAHLRVSLDYLVSREVMIGLDVRPYLLFTNLELDPVYIHVLARLSYAIDL